MDRSEIITDDSVEFVRQAMGAGAGTRARPRRPSCSGSRMDAPSMLSFKSAMEAAADVAVHADAERDTTGRHVMTRDYLRRMISAIALPCDSCADVFFGSVYWHQRDAARRQLGRRHHERHRRLRRLPGMRGGRPRGPAPALLDHRRGLTPQRQLTSRSSPACCSKPRLSSRCQLSVTLPSRTRRMSIACEIDRLALALLVAQLAVEVPVQAHLRDDAVVRHHLLQHRDHQVGHRGQEALGRRGRGRRAPAGVPAAAHGRRTRRQRLFQQFRAAVVPEPVQVVDRREDGLALRRVRSPAMIRSCGAAILTAVASSTCAAPREVAASASSACRRNGRSGCVIGGSSIGRSGTASIRQRPASQAPIAAPLQTPLRAVRRPHHARDQMLQRARRIVAPAGVHRRGLDDRAARRDQPVEALARASRRPIGAGRRAAGADRAGSPRAPRAIDVRSSAGSSASRRASSSSMRASRNARRVARDDHAGVDELAALDARHDAHDGVVIGAGTRARIGLLDERARRLQARCTRYST